MAKKVDAKNSGFIFLHRSIRKHWLWSDAKKLQWWLDILMECNHADQKVNIGFELLDCKRGQSLNSLLTWSKQWRVDVSTVRRFLKLLETDQMIVTENVVKTTRLTVCNYDSYNSKEHAKQSKNNSETIPTQFGSNTNNNDSITSNNDRAPRPKKINSFKTITKEEFETSLKDYVPKYGREMVKQFALYWREPDENGRMRFQLEKTWHTSGRLATWKRRDEERAAKTGFVKPVSTQGSADAITDSASNEILNSITSKNGTNKSKQGQGTEKETVG